MKSLPEFYFTEFDTDHVDLSEATKYLHSLLDDVKVNPFHYGDCISQNIMCIHCYLGELFQKYYLYTKENF
jgi:hypothetical protein